MTRDFKAGGRTAGMAEHPLAQPIAKAKKTGRALTRAVRHSTHAQPSISAGTFRARKLIMRGAGRRNPLVTRVREIMHTHTTNLKQTGRRYGPSPELGGIHEPWPSRTAAPMSLERRAVIYAGHPAHSYTPKQRRRMSRAAGRAMARDARGKSS